MVEPFQIDGCGDKGFAVGDSLLRGLRTTMGCLACSWLNVVSRRGRRIGDVL
jgi:hypothetical protein